MADHVAQLIAAGVHPTQAKLFSEPLKAAMALFAIDTPTRQAAFIAQCLIESAKFTRLEENLYYTTPERIRAVFPSRVLSLPDAATLARNPEALANRVYANKNGNGDEASGDGWLYRGRGLFQLTGRANYANASQGAGLQDQYLIYPERVAKPSDACLTAAWYWWDNDCNELIDSGNFDATTRKINGPAMMHRHERAEAFDDALRAFA